MFHNHNSGLAFKAIHFEATPITVLNSIYLIFTFFLYINVKFVLLIFENFLVIEQKIPEIKIKLNVRIVKTGFIHKGQ